MANTVTIDIVKGIKGGITARDLISASGMWIFKPGLSTIVSKVIGKTGYLFKIAGRDYHLEVGFKTAHSRTSFYIIRDSEELEEEVFSPFKPIVGGIFFCAMWNPTELSLLCVDQSDVEELFKSSDVGSRIRKLDKKMRILKTPPTFPPYSLVDWARKNALAPLTVYDSLGHFYEEVISSLLLSVPDKVSTFAMYRSFWNIPGSRSKISSWRPKRETDVVATIRGLLSDIEIQKNMQIVSEYPLAGGRLDFLITGSLRTGETVNVCVEFKHAHSARLEDGLLKQLPAYMQAKGSDRGIYCVLYFRGPHFEMPRQYSDSLKILHSLNKKADKAGLIPRIRVLVFDLSRPVPPSML